MNEGKIFLGGIFAIIAIYFFVAVDSLSAQIFAGGIMALLSLVTFMGAFKKDKMIKKSTKKRRR